MLDEITRFGASRGSLLDVGWFSGMFLRNARKRGFEITGIEPNEDAFMQVRNLLGCDLVHGSLASGHFSLNHFSVVTFLDVIEHVEDPVGTLKAALKTMRPGGALALVTPNVSGPLPQVERIKRNILRQPWCPIDDVPGHLWGFTHGSLTSVRRECWVVVKRISSMEPSPFTTNIGARTSVLKRTLLLTIAEASKRLGMSDRMALFAQKPFQV